MATTREGQLAKIARLMKDPRYWNKKHPENPEAFKNVQRAFEDAYPEPAPESDTTEGNVHVRAYTRMVDGKEVQVSAYDRTQQIAFHPFPLPKNAPDYLQEIAEGRLHRQRKEDIVRLLRAHGDRVETEVTLVGANGVVTRVDILGRSPEGFLYAIEVKTTAYDLFSPNQLAVYPLMHLGNHVLSVSPRIRTLGFAPLQPLPPMCVYGHLASPGKLVRRTILLSPDPSCVRPSYQEREWKP
jgi:hypothetical protein